MPSESQDLFGGAIVFDIPPGYIDVSTLRQVPDSQEVFLYPDSSISIIVEVLERVGQEGDEEAARFHFDSLAHDNSAVSSTVGSITRMSKTRVDGIPPPIVLEGTQHVRKFDSTGLGILLAVFRFKCKNVDLVLSMNIPPHTDDARHQQAQSDFRVAVESLHIVDFGLFV